MVFSSVFVIVWFGAFIVTLNAQLLGGTISFFQSVCVLGYCVAPLTLAAGTITVLRISSVRILVVDLILVGIGFLWATKASTVFIRQFINLFHRIVITN